MFERNRHINDSDRRTLDNIFEAIHYEDQERYLAEWDFYPLSDNNTPPKDLNEEEVNELLGLLKNKFGHLPHLEAALGTKLVSSLRGVQNTTHDGTTKVYTELEINDLIPKIKNVLRSDNFTWRHFNDIMSTIANMSFFNASNFLDSYDTREIFEDYYYEMHSWERNQFMNENGLMYESDMEEPYKPDNLNEEQVDELLAQIKVKYDSIQSLERFLGEKVVAQLRGVEYYDNALTEEEMVNDSDRRCMCPKVIDNQPEDIDDCATSQGKKCDAQWVGSNSHGEFYVNTCECGKISAPYLSKY